MTVRRVFSTFLMLCGALAAVPPAGAQGGEIRWFDDYSEALREAKRTGKPMLLEFRCEP